MAKKMKKLFSLILALSMVMSLMSVMASAEGLQYGCGNEEHSHGEACYELQLQCEKHVHGEASCYTQESSLTCGEDHEHAEECNTVTNVLTCTKEDHTHDDACYVSVLTCTKEEYTHSEECIVLVAKIGDVEYKTLSAAVAAANADTATEGAVVIELVGNTVFDSAMTISRAITITGAKTITRAEGYTGKLFTVASGATLTLDGGVIIDGGNNWYFASESFYADMAAGKTLSSGAKESYTESNGTASNVAMIAINGGGAVVMNSATIRNNWGSPLFSIPAKASLTMNDGSLISHIRSGNGGAVAGQLSGTWTMNGGKIEGVHGHNTNGGLVDVRGGVVTINGGEITDITTLGLNANGNGILAQVFGESSKMSINGGHIHGNASFAPGGGWGAVVYLNRGGDFTMTDGVIEDTVTDKCTAFVANTATSIELLGGTIEVDPNTVDNFDSLIYGNVVMAEGM